MKPVQRSERIRHLQQSEIRRMSRECARVGGINLGQGICDLPTPPEILHATSDAVLTDLSTYSKFEGVDNLRTQIAKKLRNYNGLIVDPATDIVVTIGTTGAFACVIQALFNPGDEILVFEPYYGYHLNTMAVGGCTPRFIPMTPPDWSFDVDHLRDALTDRTKAILINTPANPSGKVFSRAELEILADFCQEHDLLAITDEIYEYILYDERKHISLASLPGMWPRTITMTGFSKTFSITGWRLGCVIGPRAIAEPVGLINDLFYVCAPTPLQHGLARGISEIDDNYYTQLAHEYERKRDFFCQILDNIGLKPYVPQGSYYVLADISALQVEDDHAAAMHILEHAKVASVPGSAFFVSEVGKRLVRFCYAKDWETLRGAAEALQTLG